MEKVKLVVKIAKHAFMKIQIFAILVMMDGILRIKNVCNVKLVLNAKLVTLI